MLLDPPGILQLDPLLLPYVQCPEEGAEAALASLLTVHALSVIRVILLRRSYDSLDRSDLEGEVLVRLIERLRRLRRAPPEEGIRDFLGYVAVVTYNAAAAGYPRQRERSLALSEDAEPLARLADPAPDPALALERRTYLSLLWDEIRQLPQRQAAALIFNLRDGHGRNAAALLPLTGTASLRDIARAVAWSRRSWQRSGTACPWRTPPSPPCSR